MSDEGKNILLEAVMAAPECDDLLEIELDRFIAMLPSSVEPWLYGKCICHDYQDLKLQVTDMVLGGGQRNEAVRKDILRFFAPIEEEEDSLI